MVRLNYLMKGCVRIAALFAVIVLTGASASAAIITWGAAQNVNSADLSQFSTNGTLVGAVKAGTGNQTLNSVAFSAITAVNYNSPIPGSTVITFGDPNITLTAADTDIGFLNGSDFALGAYGGLMSSTTTDISYDANPAGVGGTRNLVVTGLTAGRQYEVQVWVPSFHVGSDFAHDPGAQTTTTFAGASPVTLNVGLRGDLVTPQAPQFAIGTFTADGSASQTVSFANMYWAAMQVRDITPAPEPSGIALATFGIVGTLSVQRRRRG